MHSGLYSRRVITLNVLALARVIHLLPNLKLTWEVRSDVIGRQDLDAKLKKTRNKKFIVQIHHRHFLKGGHGAYDLNVIFLLYTTVQKFCV